MEIDPRLFRTESRVLPEWIDNYGHLNMSYYVLVCDHGTYAFWEAMNAPKTQEERKGAEYAVVESHVNYLDEVREGDPLLVTTQLISADNKRFRLFHSLYHGEKGYLAATNEIMSLGFNLESRSMMEFVPEVQARLQEKLAEHADLPRHPNVGRAVGQSYKRG